MKINKLILGSIALASASVVVAKNVHAIPAAADVTSGASLPQGSISKKASDSKRLGVKPVEDHENEPTPDHAKKPLEPYGAGSGHGSNKNSAIDSDEEDNLEHASLLGKLLMPISMIVVSEIGDKTFLIAALMSMKHSRFVVFTSAFSSLAIMTILSGVIGHALPSLISQRLTQFLASILFVVFGYKLLREGLAMSKELGVEEELAEVEEELQSSDINSRMDDIEMGSPHDSSSRHQSPAANSKWYVDLGKNLKNLAGFVLSPIWIQVFVMTFLGEWGDRSQIAIIAMAAVPNYWIIILGAVIGHGICTFAACVGGKLLAARISLRNVTLGGAVAFFTFAVLYFYDAMYNADL